MANSATALSSKPKKFELLSNPQSSLTTRHNIPKSNRGNALSVVVQQTAPVPAKSLEENYSPIIDSGNPTNTTTSVGRKRLPKADRQRRREDAVLKAIYAPKDSHVQMISPAIMELMMKNRSSSNYQQSASCAQRNLSCNSGVSETKTLRVSKDSEVECSWPLDSDFPILSTSYAAATRVSQTQTAVERHKDETPIASSTPLPSVSRKMNKKKPSKNPIVINIEELLRKPSEKQSKSRIRRKPDVMRYSTKLRPIGNLLDSSGLSFIHRGKMRERPIKKRPSKLKQAILISRSLRQGSINNTSTGTEPESISLSLSTLFISNASTANEKPVGASTENSITHAQFIKVEFDNEAEIKIETSDLNTSNSLDSKPYDADKVDDGDSVTQVQEHIVQKNRNLPKAELCDMVLQENTSTPTEMIRRSSDSSLERNSEFKNIFRKLLDDAEHAAIQLRDIKVEQTETDEDLKVAIPPEVVSNVKAQMHNKKFRSYCDMYLSKELHGHVIGLMKELFRFQDRLYHMEPLKFSSNRRFIHGIKDVMSYLQLKKVQLVILAPDLESNNVKGGLDDKFEEIISTAKNNGIPYVFSGNRFILGRPIMIRNSVSVIGILSKQGAEEFVNKVLSEATKLRESYTRDFSLKVSKIMGMGELLSESKINNNVWLN